MKPVKIGVTGGIGSGKSVVSRLLGVMGVPVYISDMEARCLMQTDADIRKELTDLVGADVYLDGRLNKSLLASYIFGVPEHVRQVNRIVHPRVKEDFRRWALQQGALHPLVGIESAILLEAGFAQEVDRILMVYAPPKLRLERAMKRDSATREQIESRIRSQMRDEEKCRRADFVLYNDGRTPLIPQVLRCVEEISGQQALHSLF